MADLKSGRKKYLLEKYTEWKNPPPPTTILCFQRKNNVFIWENSYIYINMLHLLGS